MAQDDKGGPPPPAPIPLLIFHPLTPSVEQALPFVFTGDVPYQLSVHQLNRDSLDIVEDHAPSIALFSVLDEDTREQLRDMMRTRVEERQKDGKSKYDPLVRIVLVSEERKGMVLDRWQELGAHEVMLAPILSRPLLSKLERHYRKLLDVEKREQEDAEREGRAEARARDRAQRLKKAKEKAAEKPRFVIHGKALGPNTFLFPAGDDDEATSDETVTPHRVVISIEVDAAVMPPGEGIWVKNSHYPEDGDGEAASDWVVGNVGVLAEGGVNKDFDKKTVRYRFFGQKPVYDKGKKAWIFMGKAPKLYGPFRTPSDEEEAATRARNPKHKPPELEKPENMAFCASKGNGVFFFKNQVEPKKAEVLFYTQEQWEKSPMSFFEKDEAKGFWQDHRAPEDEKAGTKDYREAGKDEHRAQQRHGASRPDEAATKKSIAPRADAPPSTAPSDSEDDLDSALLHALKEARRGSK